MRRVPSSFPLLLRGFIALALTILTGCATEIIRNPVPAAAVADLPPLVALEGGRTWGDEVPADIRAEFKRHLPNMTRLAHEARVTKNGKLQVNILALSGGGPDGAFGAGVLTGWTQRGDRPEFHLVTGVSAGAIIAPFAFLDPDYDPVLKEIWTQYQTNQLLTPQILPGILGGPALADTSPLRHLIAKYVDRAFLAKVAAEYRRGRVLTVGTTNLDAKRPVVWNMGEIALKGTPEAVELFRDVIQASAAIPGLFTPVNIKVVVNGRTYDELHVDGGVTRQVYVAPLNVPYEQYNQFYSRPPQRRLFIIQNGKLTAEYEPVEEKTLPIAATSISTLLTSQSRGDIYRIYRMALDAGVDFHMLAIPDTFQVQRKQAFDPVYQKALFEEGVRLGRSPNAWSRSPPYLHPGQRLVIPQPTRKPERDAPPAGAAPTWNAFLQ